MRKLKNVKKAFRNSVVKNIASFTGKEILEFANLTTESIKLKGNFSN